LIVYLVRSEVRTRCTIGLFSCKSLRTELIQATTSLLRWGQDFREYLFPLINYALIGDMDISKNIPKISSQIQADTLAQLLSIGSCLKKDLVLSESISYNTLSENAPNFPENAVYIGGTAYSWFPAWRSIPETLDASAKPSLPARTIGFKFSDSDSANVVFAILCSSLGYWWWAVASDGFHLKKWLVESLPVSTELFEPSVYKMLSCLGENLRIKLESNYVYKDNKGRIGNFFLPACKSEIRAINSLLAENCIFFSKIFFEDIEIFNETFSRAEIYDNDDEG